jgi:hypothetical protein
MKKFTISVKKISEIFNKNSKKYQQNTLTNCKRRTVEITHQKSIFVLQIFFTTHVESNKNAASKEQKSSSFFTSNT